MQWQICFAFFMFAPCFSHVEKFNCPKECDCAIALTNVKDRYDIKCTNDAVLKYFHYHEHQAKLVRKLDLSGIRLKKLDVERLRPLKNLEILDVSNNILTDLPRPIKLNHLTDIILRNNRISTVSYWFFPKSIQKIDLGYNALAEIPETVLDLPKLEEIYLNGNLLRCSCYNRNVYNDLRKKQVALDNHQCWEDSSQHAWGSMHLECTDQMLADEMHPFFGSGDGELTDADDLSDFIPVNENDLHSTTEKTVENSVPPIGEDFYFPEDKNSTLFEGSGGEPLDSGSGNDDFIPVIRINETSTYSPEEDASEEDDLLSGSGDFDDELEDAENSTTPIPILFSPQTTTMEPISEEEITTPIVVVPTELPEPSSTPVEEIFIQKEIVPLDRNVEIISPETDTNINEELGEVQEEGPKKQAFGTHIFLAILLAVLICLIGYTILKRRINRAPRSNENRRPNDLINATEMKDMDKGAMALLSEENEKKKSNGRVTEASPMLGNSDTDSPVHVNGKSMDEDGRQGSNSPMGQRPESPAGAERVRITMTELTDSIPRTPVLVTRTKSSSGDEIIVTPNLNQRPTLRNP